MTASGYVVTRNTVSKLMPKRKVAKTAHFDG